MATWYVRPDISHNTTRNGTSYATAWGGWPAIVWGGAGVVGGDTLYVCGAHTAAAILAVGNHGATVSNRVTIRGDYALSPGSILVAGGNYYFNINRSYTDLLNVTVVAGTGPCVMVTGAPSNGVTIRGCTFFGAADAMIKMLALDTWSYVDLTIDSNTFSGGSGGTGGSAIQWYVTSAITSRLTNLQITNNNFTKCSAARAVILLRVLNAALVGTKMADVRISGNTFNDCGAAMMEVYGPEVTDRNTGIQIYDNKIYNQTMVGGLGGAIVLGGFGHSLTENFGENVIYNNKAYGLNGPTGFVNPMWGTYKIFENEAEDIATTTIDGCGILFDHGCHDTVAFGNKFKRITGTGVKDYTSGFGILVLDATNCEAYGNVFDGCVIGVGYGNKVGGQSSNIHNNTFLDVSLSGFNGNGGADFTTNNLVRNNLLKARSPDVASVRFLAGVWGGESHNAFEGFGPPTQTLHATDMTVTDSLLDEGYRPHNHALKRTGTYLGGKDLNGKQFYNPPNIGAVDDATSTPRYLLAGS